MLCKSSKRKRLVRTHWLRKPLSKNKHWNNVVTNTRDCKESLAMKLSDNQKRVTNKAAGEMKARVAALVGPRARSMWVMTFHSACVRILRREAKRFGYPS